MHDSLATKARSGADTLSHAVIANSGTPVLPTAEGNNAALALVLMRSLSESVYLITAEGRVFFANGPGLDRLGQSCGQGCSPVPVHRNWLELWPAADSQSLTTAFAAALDGDTTRVSVTSQDDQRKMDCCDLTIAPVEDASGAISRVLCIARSIAPAA